jgi:hypothetical protein
VTKQGQQTKQQTKPNKLAIIWAGVGISTGSHDVWFHLGLDSRTTTTAPMESPSPIVAFQMHHSHRPDHLGPAENSVSALNTHFDFLHRQIFLQLLSNNESLINVLFIQDNQTSTTCVY